MSAIAGVVDFRHRAVDPQALRAMADAVRHRGPDDEGYVMINGRSALHAAYSGPDSPEAVHAATGMSIQMARPIEGFNIGLSQRRFAVVDLSPGGHQPMFSHDQVYCAAFDGQIYNYVELREELQSLGVTFRSQSDTEVLLESYRYWDTDCFSRFNGVWAVALYDFPRRRLILSRDRIGEKPLYWTRSDDRLFFASEIKSLLTNRHIAAARRVNEPAVWHWCVSGRRDLDNSTLFANIRSFPAACWTSVDFDFPAKVRPYWELPRTRLTERKIRIPEATHLLRESLDDAVRIRSRGDAAVAIELSGGIDSSSVLALAARHHPGRLTSYTVTHRNQRWNNEPFANAIANRYDVDYRVTERDLSGFWHGIAAFTCLQEEPYHSPNLQSNLAVRARIRSDGMRASLSGAGGDELFAGSARYYGRIQFENFLHGRWLRFASNTWHRSDQRQGFWSAVGEMMGAHGFGPLMKSLKRSTLWLEEHPLRHIAAPAQHYAATASDSLYQETLNTRVPYWLRSGEKTYMGVPLSPRCPFLDHRVIEVAMRLPTTYLVRDGWHKWILRRAMKDVLPPEFVWRRVKRGLPNRHRQFLATHRDVIELILSGSENPYLDFNRKGGLRTNWNVISFILWYEYFINENYPLFERIEDMVGARPLSEGYVPKFHESAGPLLQS